MRLVIRFIPNIITVIAMLLGLLSIRYSFEHDWRKAIAMIMLAAICDSLDGRVARFMKTESAFGSQLDSLADLINFGVAPAILLYLKYLCFLDKFGWSACQFFIICQALRLARFNTTNHMNYFTGVPAPAGASLLMTPLLLEVSLHSSIIPIIVYFWVILISMLSISRFKTFSSKTINIKKFWPLAIIVSILLTSFPWFTLLLGNILYFISLSFRKFFIKYLH